MHSSGLKALDLCNDGGEGRLKSINNQYNNNKKACSLCDVTSHYLHFSFSEKAGYEDIFDLGHSVHRNYEMKKEINIYTKRRNKRK